MFVGLYAVGVDALPLVGEGAGQAIGVGYAGREAVRVWPAAAVPVMVGTPVKGVLFGHVQGNIEPVGPDVVLVVDLTVPVRRRTVLPESSYPSCYLPGAVQPVDGPVRPCLAEGPW